MNARPDLFHYSDAPLRAVRSVKQSAAQPNGYVSVFGKPNGLWLSVDGENDWPSWCEGNSFALASLTYRHRIVLHDSESLLWLTTSDALLNLTNKFGIDVNLGDAYRGRAIDWSAVARTFSGIVIAPYHWSRRMDDRTSWYYGWDCASGCIWNASAVAAVETTPPRQVTEAA